jgi:hypothetical protein
MDVATDHETVIPSERTPRPLPYEEPGARVEESSCVYFVASLQPGNRGHRRTCGSTTGLAVRTVDSSVGARMRCKTPESTRRLPRNDRCALRLQPDRRRTKKEQCSKEYPASTSAAGVAGWLTGARIRWSGPLVPVRSGDDRANCMYHRPKKFSWPPAALPSLTRSRQPTPALASATGAPCRPQT